MHNLSPKAATMTASSVLALLTLLIVVNGDKWPTLVPIFVALGLLGLYVAKSFDTADKLTSFKWRLILVSTVINTVLYICLALIVARQRNSQSFTAGLVLMGFLIMPFYYGVSALLAQYLIRSE